MKNQSCINGTWVDDYSVVNEYFSPEGIHCDGLDNDCDSIVDDHLTPPKATLHKGVCENATQICVNSSWVDPNYSNIANYLTYEICDGLDNNCNGLIDENLGYGNLSSNQKGVCEGTHQICSGGIWIDQYQFYPNGSNWLD